MVASVRGIRRADSEVKADPIGQRRKHYLGYCFYVIENLYSDKCRKKKIVQDELDQS